MTKITIALAWVLLGAGCGLSTESGSKEARYDLVCAEHVCVRVDTSDGDVRRIDIAGLEQSAGSTIHPIRRVHPVGSYEVGCARVHHEDTGVTTVTCVRLDKVRGDLVRLDLESLPSHAAVI